MCAIDDCDPFSVSSTTHPRARRDHRCCDCGRVISRGEVYQRCNGLYDGYWSIWIVCGQCIAAGEWLVAMCRGWLYEGIGQELEEHWLEEWSLRSIGLARLVVAHKRGWRRRDGSLVPADDVRRWASVGVARVTA